MELLIVEPRFGVGKVAIAHPNQQVLHPNHQVLHGNQQGEADQVRTFPVLALQQAAASGTFGSKRFSPIWRS